MQFNTTHFLHSLKHYTTIFSSRMKLTRSYDLSEFSQESLKSPKSRVLSRTCLLYLFVFFYNDFYDISKNSQFSQLRVNLDISPLKLTQVIMIDRHCLI